MRETVCLTVSYVDPIILVFVWAAALLMIGMCAGMIITRWHDAKTVR